MSREILTNSISDPNIQQPFTGKSLKWLQDAWKEETLALIRNMIGDSNYGPSPFVVYGLRDTGTYPVVNIAAGYVHIDGELYACTGLSTTLTGADVVVATITTAYDTAFVDPVTFTDGVPRNVHQIKTVVLSAGASGSADYDYTDFAFMQDLGVKEKIIAIGDWNMDSTGSVNVPHGLTDHTKVLGWDVMILSDNSAVVSQLDKKIDAATDPGGGAFVDSTNIQLYRVAGGYYDQVAYDATSFNRGYVTIRYQA